MTSYMYFPNVFDHEALVLMRHLGRPGFLRTYVENMQGMLRHSWQSRPMGGTSALEGSGPLEHWRLREN